MHLKKYLYLAVALVIGAASPAFVQAQIVNLPYSPDLYQKMDNVVYSPHTRYHTAIKPYIIKNELKAKLDSIQSNEPYPSQKWFLRKIFNEHLLQDEKADYTFYADFLPDMLIGKDFGTTDRSTWMNTRGVQVGITVKDKFSLYTNFFENQAVFPEYYDNYVVARGVVPGQAYRNLKENNSRDWMYSTATMGYEVADYLHVSLGYDKTFIGDGYRSMLLSDFSSNFANLRLTGTLGNFSYLSMWGYMNDPTNPRTDTTSTGDGYRLGDGKKWGAFQYVDWNITRRLSLGLFQSTVWAIDDQYGHRGFDALYLFPVVLAKGVDRQQAKADKLLLGLNGRYKVWNNWSAYGQFLLSGVRGNHLLSGDGYRQNQWSTQIGLKGFDVFGIPKLNILAEYNTARPYTYTHEQVYANYSNNSEALAHPLGANFRELVGIVNYAWKRWDFRLQGMYYKKGLDANSLLNAGGDIFKAFATTNIPEKGNSIGQGLQNTVYYGDAKVAYVLNPKYNLRLELGYTQRYSKTYYDIPTVARANQISFGLRSAFRGMYTDF